MKSKGSVMENMVRENCLLLSSQCLGDCCGLHVGCFTDFAAYYIIVNIFSPHRSTTYVDAAYSYDRVAWSVGLSVGLSH